MDRPSPMMEVHVRRIRHWLIRRLAGSDEIVLNAHIKDGVLIVKPSGTYIANSTITNSTAGTGSVIWSST